MEREKLGRCRKKACFIAVFLAVNLLAVLLVGCRESKEIGRRMTERAKETGVQFGDVMEDYRHSFRLFVQMLQAEIKSNPDPDDIWDFLKELDPVLLGIEGETFDGLYMYYQGRYLYSWDTPYSQYEETGYVATERPWYKDAEAGGGQIVFTPPYMSYANHYVLTTLSQMQPDGETVFAYDIKMGAIQELVSSIQRYDGEQIMIYDENGTVIGSTDEMYLGGCLYDTMEDVEQSVADAEKLLEEADRNNAEQVSKAEDQLNAIAAFRDFRKEMGDQLEQLRIEERLFAGSQHIKLVTLDSGKYFGLLHEQGGFHFLILVPIWTMLGATLGSWLVPLLVIELLLIYIFSRISRGIKNRELKMAYIELGQTQKRLEIALSAAQKAAAIDDLTGMMNFKSFRAGVVNILESMEEGESGLLIMIDGDHFKTINDQYGHNIGDEVIKLSAQMIIGRIRTVDLASRLHGDEFAIFVANTADYAVGKGIMADINSTIAKEAKKRNMPSITLSGGAVIAKRGDSYAALSKAADEALYRAKETHNGGYAF